MKWNAIHTTISRNAGLTTGKDRAAGWQAMIITAAITGMVMIILAAEEVMIGREE